MFKTKYKPLFEKDEDIEEPKIEPKKKEVEGPEQPKDEPKDKPEVKGKDKLSHLQDPDIAGALIDFIKANPYPVDKQVHDFAEKELELDPDQLENYAYAIISAFLTGGKSSEVKDYKYNQDQLTMGQKVEQEHLDVKNIKNPVVAAIVDKLATKVAMDHQSESDKANSGYYTDLAKMEKGQAKGKEKLEDETPEEVVAGKPEPTYDYEPSDYGESFGRHTDKDGFFKINNGKTYRFIS